MTCSRGLHKGSVRPRPQRAIHHQPFGFGFEARKQFSGRIYLTLPQSRRYRRCVSDRLSAAQISAAAELASATAYGAARSAAAEMTLVKAATTLGEPVESAVEILMRRDGSDARYQLLAGLELAWSLLVVRILNRVLRPTEAVADARARGATWTQLGEALGVTAASAQQRFKEISR